MPRFVTDSDGPHLGVEIDYGASGNDPGGA